MLEVTRYDCGGGDCELHDTFDEALKCATARIIARKGYECEICGMWCDTKEKCQKCCTVSSIEHEITFLENLGKGKPPRPNYTPVINILRKHLEMVIKRQETLDKE